MIDPHTHKLLQPGAFRRVLHDAAAAELDEASLEGSVIVIDGTCEHGNAYRLTHTCETCAGGFTAKEGDGDAGE